MKCCYDPDSAVLLGWDLHLHCRMTQWLVHWGAVLGPPVLKVHGAKSLFRSIALALGVSSLPLQPYDAVHSLKKPHETGQVC